MAKLSQVAVATLTANVHAHMALILPARLKADASSLDFWKDDTAALQRSYVRNEAKSSYALYHARDAIQFIELYDQPLEVAVWLEEWEIANVLVPTDYCSSKETYIKYLATL
jgi:hypothetical protein